MPCRIRRLLQRLARVPLPAELEDLPLAVFAAFDADVQEPGRQSPTLHLGDHPLLGIVAALNTMTTASIASLWDLPEAANDTVGGIYDVITRRYTRAGDTMLFFQLEDL